MTQWIAIVGTGITTLGVIIVAWLTRRTAKDQTAVGGFGVLVDKLQNQNDRQEGRIQALEREAEERRQLDAMRGRILRAHERWDQQLVNRLRQVTDETFPDPPPLDVEV